MSIELEGTPKPKLEFIPGGKLNEPEENLSYKAEPQSHCDGCGKVTPALLIRLRHTQREFRLCIVCLEKLSEYAGAIVVLNLNYRDELEREPRET